MDSRGCLNGQALAPPIPREALTHSPASLVLFIIYLGAITTRAAILERGQSPLSLYLLLVAGFRDVLKDYGIDVVETAHSLDGLVDRFLVVKPDVLVIDVRFDSKGCGENGLDVCEKLLSRDPSARIIVFSQFDDQYIIERSYKLGVLAFVRKDESTEVLNEAINTVAQGKEYFSPEIARLLAWSAVIDRNPNRLLDENEMRAFTLAADGASMAEIAVAMDFSTKTVGHLMKGVKTKLGVESQADITKLAIRYGITTTSPKKKS